MGGGPSSLFTMGGVIERERQEAGGDEEGGAHTGPGLGLRLLRVCVWCVCWVGDFPRSWLPVPALALPTDRFPGTADSWPLRVPPLETVPAQTQYITYTHFQNIAKC
jgi:hypothetical protein